MLRACILVSSTATGVVLATFYRRELRKQWVLRTSQYLEKTMEKPDKGCETVLGNFRNQTIVQAGLNHNNPHKHAAAVRSSAVTFIRMLNLRLGTTENCVSMSANDQRSGAKGSRFYFWAKDVDKSVTNDTEGARSYVDVDYHCDDLEYDLAGRSSHTTLFTIIPTKAASSGETSHTFNTNNEIDVVTSGGGRYTHPIWDWTPDMITCVRSYLGLPYVTTIYKVEKKTIDHLKALVVLSPIGTWRGISAILAAKLQGSRLKRLQPVTNGFTHIKCSTPEGIKHSVAECGSFTSADVTSEEFDAIKQSVVQGKQLPTTGSVATWCEQRRVDAVLLAGYFRSCTGEKAPFVTEAKDSVQSVSANVDKHGDTQERVSVQAFMQPIVAGNCHAHTDHQDNADWAIEARITKIAAKTTQRLNPFTAQCIKEFVELTFPQPVTKSDLDEVYDKQSRPTQRSIIAEAVNTGQTEKTSLKAFLKKEAYAGAKDPRIITTYNPNSKVEYSTYMYGVSTQMKKHAWYGFKTPEEIAARVAQICVNSEYVIEGDFSRMDGRIDHNIRNTFEKAILNKCYPDDDEVQKLHDKQYGQTVHLGPSIYNQGYARGSGSPETSCFNTCLTGFTAYYTERLMHVEPEEAFANIGIVAGDDSLQGGNNHQNPDDHAKKYERAASRVGQKLTSDLKKIGQPVTFLSRVWGHAWHGDMNSMTCPLRLLSKVHTTVNIGDVRPEDKCHQKGESMLAGDANTPIIGPLAKKMTSVGTILKSEHAYRVNNYWARFNDCSWPNEYCDWMEDIIREEMPGFDYEAFEHWIEEGDVFNAPTCFSITPKEHERPLMVDGLQNLSAITRKSKKDNVKPSSSKSSTSSVSGRKSRRGTSSAKSGKSQLQKTKQRKENCSNNA
jgi:hypothetical protein